MAHMQVIKEKMTKPLQDSRFLALELRKPLITQVQDRLGLPAMPQVVDGTPSAHKMPQLDALRTFAVLAVLFAHFVSHAPRWVTIIPWAACGVQLFFVLSGFLITGILLDGRKEVEAGTSRFWMLRQFYARRFLRIIPLYYAVVLVGWIIKLPGFTKTVGWNLAYSTNFYIVLHGEWIDVASHLWTLSVEEQFYLVWPWIVLFFPKKWLLPSFIGLAIFAMAYRVLAMGWFGPWLGVTPFASLDCFGAGALLAMAQRREIAGDPRLRRTVCGIGLCLGLALFVLAVGWHIAPQSALGRLGAMNLAMTLLSAPLISGAAKGFTGILGSILTLRSIRYIGKISYGIYIYHLPVWWTIDGSRWLNALPRIIPHSAVFLIATVTVAAISWHFFERPINQLKRFFPYRDTGSHRQPEIQLPGVSQEIELESVSGPIPPG
jgi:peptidoglycan/LPS O-acetylase OafA/YrhL